MYVGEGVARCPQCPIGVCSWIRVYFGLIPIAYPAPLRAQHVVVSDLGQFIVVVVCHPYTQHVVVSDLGQASNKDVIHVVSDSAKKGLAESTRDVDGDSDEDGRVEQVKGRRHERTRVFGPICVCPVVSALGARGFCSV